VLWGCLDTFSHLFSTDEKTLGKLCAVHIKSEVTFRVMKAPIPSALSTIPFHMFYHFLSSPGLIRLIIIKTLLISFFLYSALPAALLLKF
jgi:hypothetical protein